MPLPLLVGEALGALSRAPSVQKIVKRIGTTPGANEKRDKGDAQKIMADRTGNLYAEWLHRANLGDPRALDILNWVTNPPQIPPTLLDYAAGQGPVGDYPFVKEGTYTPLDKRPGIPGQGRPPSLGPSAIPDSGDTTPVTFARQTPSVTAAGSSSAYDFGPWVILAALGLGVWFLARRGRG